MSTIERQSVDLSSYPDLVMILLGFRISRLRGLSALLQIGPGMRRLRSDPPDGLLSHEQFMFGWRHLGIRQYWRDFDSLERFTRDSPHAEWQRRFLRDDGGAGFWHETYRASGGIEAIYLNMPDAIGLKRFAPTRAPVGRFFSARDRLASPPA